MGHFMGTSINLKSQEFASSASERGRHKLTSPVREDGFAPGVIQIRTKDEGTKGEGAKRNI